jgi:hypothetical protein
LTTTVLAVAALLASPAVWLALGDDAISLDTLVWRLGVAVAVCWAASAAVHTFAPRPRRADPPPEAG